jgi:hypothetical protein
MAAVFRANHHATMRDDQTEPIDICANDGTAKPLSQEGSTKMDSYKILADDLQLSERQARRVLAVFVDNEQLLQSAQGRYVRRLNVFNKEEVLEQFQSHCAQQEERLEIDLLCAELNDNIIPAVYSIEDQAKMKLVSFILFAQRSRSSQVFHIWSAFSSALSLCKTPR